MKKMTFPSELQFRRFMALMDREIKVVFSHFLEDGRVEVGLEELENPKKKASKNSVLLAIEEQQILF